MPTAEKSNGHRKSCAALDHEVSIRESNHRSLLDQLDSLRLAVSSNTIAQVALAEQMRAHSAAHEKNRVFWERVVKYWIPVGFAVSQWVHSRSGVEFFDALQRFL